MKLQQLHHANTLSANRQISQPTVFITTSAEIHTAIEAIVNKFTLNVEQSRGFRIVAAHSIGFKDLLNQLLIGVFGNGGTGKSRVVEAIRHWFEIINQQQRLIVTATTGAAAVKIYGSTLHSAVSIPVEAGDPQGNKVLAAVRRKDKHILIWKHADYIIFDEASMMDDVNAVDYGLTCSTKSSTFYEAPTQSTR